MPKLVITFFGLGLLPIAPGTWGSAGAVAIWVGLWLMCTVAGVPRAAFELGVVGLTVLACAGTVRWGPWAVQAYGRPDPGQCVSDEAAGQWLALLWMPAASGPQAFIVAGVQFVLFRFFDIVKVPPARQLERLSGGWGILMDDLAAAVQAGIVGQILFRVVWPLGN
ncbi:MAG: phosphatidylglycerophosphatase A [Phycisphaerales bacterium]|nr:MAG: phosphatidylglycerophosphatase A [Phycisphaerales bacterium]